MGLSEDILVAADNNAPDDLLYSLAITAGVTHVTIPVVGDINSALPS